MGNLLCPEQTVRMRMQEMRATSSLNSSQTLAPHEGPSFYLKGSLADGVPDTLGEATALPLAVCVLVASVMSDSF